MNIPTEQALFAAESMLRDAADYAFMTANDGEGSRNRNWSKLRGHLQDALAELGFDLLPLKEPPPATPEAYFDASSYARDRGGV